MVNDLIILHALIPETNHARAGLLNIHHTHVLLGLFLDDRIALVDDLYAPLLG